MDRAGLISSSNRNNQGHGSKIGISAGMSIIKKPSHYQVNDKSASIEYPKIDEMNHYQGVSKGAATTTNQGSTLNDKDPYRLKDSPAQKLYNNSLKRNLLPENNESIYNKGLREKSESVLDGLEFKMDKPPFNDRSNQNQGLTTMTYGLNNALG